MWNLRRIMELQASAQSTTWSDVLSLYFWRAKEADLRLARMINNVSVKLRAAIEEYQLFTQELEASPGWVVNKDRSIEYLQELVQRDEEMVQRLQALEREVEERADEKMLFIEKLKGNTRLRELMSSPGAPSTPSYFAGHSTPPSYSSGPSTPPSYSSGPSTPTNYSLGSSRNGECSNCKHLRGKISVLKATMEMHMHPEQHTVNSAALFHEVLNEMEKLDLE
ncbi:hypothetical protein Tco_1031518 [Tanacetum coccineum]|uniref:Uncharacterized protein n=1 Tax=Tanacetum coccineum TaxID=301880 RepID=A0ABQ5GBG9_9ASTR